MKVGLISYHSFFRPGGVKQHILGLYKEFKKRGIQVKIIAPRRSKTENYGKDVILLGTSFPFPFSGGQSDFSVNFNHLAIGKVLEKEKFDILHFHNCGLPSSFQILAGSQSLNILTFHANPEGSKFFKNFPLLLYILERSVQWKVDGVIGVVVFNLSPFRNYKGPKTIIPNGIDLEEFNPQIPKIKKFSDPEEKQTPYNHRRSYTGQASYGAGGKINILFVGRIEKRKGLIYLLRAYKILARKFKNLRLIIVGEGDLKKECQKFVKKYKLPNVCFEGEKTGRQLPPYYTSSDIFVSPAIFGESFGIVLLEAMASGVPVVAFANQGYKEFLKDKKGAFLVGSKDYRNLAKKIEILVQDQQLRKEMGEQGLKEAQNYSWDKIAGQVLDFYEFCRKNKKKRKKENPLILDKIINKIYNKNILSWFKKPE